MKHWRVIIGTLVGLVTLWLAFRGEHVADLWQTLRRADPGWTGAALVIVGLSIPLLALRWQVLFRPDYPATPRPTLGALSAAVAVGQAVNIALPIRLGEVLRIYMVSRASGLAFARVLATVVVERLADLAVMALAAGALALQMTLPADIAGPARALVIAGLVAVGLLVAAAAGGRRLGAAIQAHVNETAHRTLARLARQSADAADAAAALRHPGTAASALVLTALSLVIAAAANYCLFRAFGLPLTPSAALFLLIVLQIGTAPVSTPGSLGVFQYLTILALSVYAVDRSTALAYSLLLYAVALVPKLLVGGVMIVCATRNGWLEPAAWGSLRRRA